jgi:hypothetical protein
VQTEGIQSIYKGLSFSILATLPYNALSFGLYSHVSKVIESIYEKSLSEKSNENSFNIFNSIIAGIISGWATGVLTYPMDTIRRHMQLRGTHLVGGEMPKYLSTVDCIKQIYKKIWIKWIL